MWIVLGKVTVQETWGSFVLCQELEVGLDKMPWDVVALMHPEMAPVMIVVRAGKRKVEPSMKNTQHTWMVDR